MSKLNEIMSEIEKLKQEREAAHKQLQSDLSKLVYDTKINNYKLNAAIKYESHLHNEAHTKLQTHLSTLHWKNYLMRFLGI